MAFFQSLEQEAPIFASAFGFWNTR